MKAGTARVHEAIGRLQRLVDLFQQRRAQLAQGAGLTESQWEILERIASEHFMPSLFARHRESSAPAVSRIIRQLLRKKLITVSVSDTDGRQRRYQLTPRVVWDVGVGTEFVGPGDRSRFFGVTGFSFGF